MVQAGAGQFSGYWIRCSVAYPLPHVPLRSRDPCDTYLVCRHHAGWTKADPAAPCAPRAGHSKGFRDYFGDGQAWNAHHGWPHHHYIPRRPSAFVVRLDQPVCSDRTCRHRMVRGARSCRRLPESKAVPWTYSRTRRGTETRASRIVWSGVGHRVPDTGDLTRTSGGSGQLLRAVLQNTRSCTTSVGGICRSSCS